MVAPQLIVNEVVEQSVSTPYLLPSECSSSPPPQHTQSSRGLPIVSPRKEPAARIESAKRPAPDHATASASKKTHPSNAILNPATALVMEAGVEKFMRKYPVSSDPEWIVEYPANHAPNVNSENPRVSNGPTLGPPCDRRRKIEKSVSPVTTVVASATLSHIGDSISQTADCGTATPSPEVPARPTAKATASRVVVAPAMPSPTADSPLAQRVPDPLVEPAPAPVTVDADQCLGPSPARATGSVDCQIHGNLSWPPSDAALLTAIRAAIDWSPPRRSLPVFDFRLSSAAAHSNFATLRAHNFDLNSIVFADPRSILRPGSEFRPTSLLEPIFQGHPLWPRFRESLHIGASYPLEPIAEEDRLSDLVAAIEYGNHKSARVQGAMLIGILEKEVSKGWQLPLPIDRLTEIPRCVVGPLGVAHQETIDALGQRVPKDRVTHDQSFAFESGRSVNNRVRTDELTPCRYGFALRRFIHLIVALRTRYPDVAILLSKFDFKSAYRRVHAAAETVLQSVVTTKGLGGDELALASLRLTFGGSPCPSLFSDISEPTTDLANAISSLPRLGPAVFPLATQEIDWYPAVARSVDRICYSQADDSGSGAG